MIITLVCECDHPNWMHTYDMWCNFCRCNIFKVDNLKSLEYTYGSTVSL